MVLTLDTSALVAIERAIEREKDFVYPAKASLVLPVIVWAEALTGVRMANSPIRAARRRARLEIIRQRSAFQFFSPEIAEHYADIFAELSARGLKIPQNDLAVAATARFLKTALLVGPADEDHFRRVQDLEVVVIET